MTVPLLNVPSLFPSYSVTSSSPVAVTTRSRSPLPVISPVATSRAPVSLAETVCVVGKAAGPAEAAARKLKA